MEANELRIGNYVYDGEKELCKIWAVHKDRLTVEIPNDNTTFLGRYKIEYAKPIPLTKDWLLKFGFEAGFNGEYEILPFLYIWKPSPSTKSFSVSPSTLEIKYVHQLQNLYFALTGEELKIKE
tara:strand:+ start:401 stop:769 length:369 start_codon:yes stop_codon:yes gene_type:complete